MDSRTGPHPEEPHRPRTEPRLVKIAELVLDGSPRLDGEDVRHTWLLAAAGAALPPILVHGETMRVLDGLHRVQAARLRGETEIRVVYFHGDEDAAFVKAVEANVSHGLPLPLADRRVAAARIISCYPDWSDRAVADAAGLAPKTVRGIRERVSPAAEHPVSRLGRDGKVRPLSTAESRQRAAVLIAQRPEAPLREIANAAGVSVATARDVRLRVRSGENPVPRGVRHAGRPSHAGMVPGTDAARAVRQLHKAVASSQAATPSSLLQRLKEDPSLRYSEKGRLLLRWLDSHVIESADWSQAADGVPPHCVYTIAELAIRCAKAWERLAEELWVLVEDSSTSAAA